MSGGHEDDSPIDVPEPPPVFFVLGSVPAIIRCWLTKDFANNTLIYAAVCTGARKSTIDFSLVKELGLDDLVYREVDNSFKIHLQTYLAEAIPATKSTVPVPQIPFLAINFEVVGAEHIADSENNNGIRIFIGSDALRAHSADILFSRNLLSVYSSEREKLTVPFVRPENDALFKNLCTVSAVPGRLKLNAAAAEFVSSDAKSRDSINGADDEHNRLDEYDDDELDSLPDDESRHFHGQQDDNADQEGPHLRRGPPGLQNLSGTAGNSSILTPGAISPTSAHPIPPAKWHEGASGAASENGAEGEKVPRNSTSSDYSGKDAGPNADGGRRDASAIWGSWRQGGSTTGSDGGHRENGPLSGYQPAGRSRTMKVLKPKVGNGSTSARTGSSYEPPPPPRSSGEHRRKSQGPSGTAVSANEGGSGSGGGNNAASVGNGGGTTTGGSATPSNVIRWESKRSISSSNAAAHNAGHGKENKAQQGLAALELRNNTSSAPRTSNPVGGASAFAWMKSSRPQPSSAE
ncbi:hypothetical protein SPBR_00524 [Sporothrix brasiliensis 5110]|uniref:Ubiquitin carboxyl-terminal hydrolase 19 n=1 Tax=Sporothrix brasiliensis 5110 TaxID=1398154 RepID=A0A0C2IV70_9PEZI|nr:uncharacterized protein SPBR_00524 [Sporothrix brasiliensis 5110]KIH90660.1 hypothetical protein SPBR_00524 [Sporothrix brasiliensis 5110]